MLPSRPGSSRIPLKEPLCRSVSGPLELVIVLIILLVIFGAKRLPEIGRGLGSSAREFKEGITGAPDPKEGEAISGPKPEDDKSA